MSEWADLEELDAEIKGKKASAGGKSSSKRKSAAAAAAAAAANADDSNAATAASNGEATADSAMSSDAPVSASASSDSSAAPHSAAMAAAGAIDELTLLREENERLRKQIAAQHMNPARASIVAAAFPAAAAAAAAAAAPAPRSKKDLPLLERPKLRISYQSVSNRVRKHLDTLVIQAELSRPSCSDPQEQERMDMRALAASCGAVAGGTRSALAQPGGVQYLESFALDRQGIRCGPSVYQPLDADLFDVPQYEGPINVVPLPLDVRGALGPDVFAQLASCFNCGLSHQMRDCPNPREEGCIRVNTLLFREYAQGRNKADGSLMANNNPGGGGGGGGGPGGQKGGGQQFTGRYYTEAALAELIMPEPPVEQPQPQPPVQQPSADAVMSSSARVEDGPPPLEDTAGRPAAAAGAEDGEIMLDEDDEADASAASSGQTLGSPAKSPRKKLAAAASPAKAAAASAAIPAAAHPAAGFHADGTPLAPGEYFMHAVTSLHSKGAESRLPEEAAPRSDLQVLDNEDDELVEAIDVEAEFARTEGLRKAQMMDAAVKRAAEAREKARRESEEHAAKRARTDDASAAAAAAGSGGMAAAIHAYNNSSTPQPFTPSRPPPSPSLVHTPSGNLASLIHAASTPTRIVAAEAKPQFSTSNVLEFAIGGTHSSTAGGASRGPVSSSGAGAGSIKIVTPHKMWSAPNNSSGSGSGAPPPPPPPPPSSQQQQQQRDPRDPPHGAYFRSQPQPPAPSNYPPSQYPPHSAHVPQQHQAYHAGVPPPVPAYPPQAAAAAAHGGYYNPRHAPPPPPPPPPAYPPQAYAAAGAAPMYPPMQPAAPWMPQQPQPPQHHAPAFYPPQQPQPPPQQPHAAYPPSPHHPQYPSAHGYAPPPQMAQVHSPHHPHPHHAGMFAQAYAQQPYNQQQQMQLQQQQLQQAQQQHAQQHPSMFAPLDR